MSNFGSGYVRKAGASGMDWVGIAAAIRASATYVRAVASTTADEVASIQADTLEELAAIAEEHASNLAG